MVDASRSGAARAFVRALIVGGTAVLCVAGNGESARAETGLSLVERFMRAGFPELFGQQLRLFVSIDTFLDTQWADVRHVSLNVRAAGTRLKLEGSLEAAYDNLLDGFFMVDATGSVVTNATFHGRHVKTRELVGLENNARANNWGDRDVKLALETLRAQYGPDQGALFKRNLNIRRFEAVLGRVLSWDARFEWRLPSDTGAGDIMPPKWLVRVETMGQGRGRRMCYSLQFEPITGHLAGLSGGRCASRQ